MATVSGEFHYGVTLPGLFGSFARNNAYETSDIETVIELTGPDIRRYFYLQGQDEIRDNAALKNGQEKCYGSPQYCILIFSNDIGGLL